MLATIYKLDLRNWGLSIEGVVSLWTRRRRVGAREAGSAQPAAARAAECAAAVGTPPRVRRARRMIKRERQACARAAWSSHLL